MRLFLFMGILFALEHSILAETRWSELVAEGEHLYVQQRYAEAEAKFRTAMKTPGYAASAEVRASIRCSLGTVVTNLRRYDEAEALLKGCPTSTAMERFIAWVNLANLYSAEGRYPEADRFYRQAFALAQQQAGIRANQRAALLDSWAVNSMWKQDFSEAQALLREARDVYIKIGAAWDSANITGNLAIALVKEGRLAEARAELEQAVSEIEALGGKSHPMLVGPLGVLAQVDNREGRYADAESRLKRAVAAAGPDYPYLAELLATYAETLRHLHRGSAAKAMEKRAHALAATRRPPDVISVSELLRQSGKQ